MRRPATAPTRSRRRRPPPPPPQQRNASCTPASAAAATGGNLKKNQHQLTALDTILMELPLPPNTPAAIALRRVAATPAGAVSLRASAASAAAPAAAAAAKDADDALGELGEWIERRVNSLVAAARDAEHTLSKALGRRPDAKELRATPAGALALGRLERLLELREFAIAQAGEKGSAEADARCGRSSSSTATRRATARTAATAAAASRVQPRAVESAARGLAATAAASSVECGCSGCSRSARPAIARR